MKSRALITLFLLLLSLSLSAGIRSSRIQQPEKIVQGEALEVRYVLEISGSWQYQVSGESVDGIQFLKLDQTKKRLSSSLSRVEIIYRIKCLAAGEVQLPAITVSTDKGPQTVAGATLQVEPNPEYGAAWRIARDFLLRQGEDCRNLDRQHSAGGVHAFYDPRRDVFTWATPSDVVAYGNGLKVQTGEENHIIEQLFKSCAGGRFAEIPEGTLAPLLGDIALGQSGKYCQGFPKVPFRGRDSTCVTGCGAVALAQVLLYYGTSVRPAGKGELTVAGAAPIPVDIAGSYRDGLADNELLYLSAASLRSELSPEGTSTNAAWFRHALVGNWGFSPACRYRVELSIHDLTELVRAELEAGRPVFLATKDHVLVCDGCKDGFLHLNFGWGGVCNGWYRLPEDAYFPECLTGVMPMRPEEDYALEVTVKKAGTLAAAIPADRASEVTRLKVSGKIRGEDIALLRRMATEGSLMELDLSNAKIVGGPLVGAQPYVERDASGMTLTSQYRNVLLGIQGTPKEWKMDEMTDEQWEEMTRRGLNYGPGYSLVRDGQGVRVRYYSREDTVSPYMFADCENLLRLRLPRTIASIEEKAFWNCSCLEQLILPRGPVGCSDQALEGTRPFLEIHRK